jgi:4'-phosphopantetheinyl transferase
MQQLGHILKWQTAETGSTPDLRTDDVHLWKFDLRLNDSESALALQFLNDIQRDKYHRRSTSQLKEAYLAGRFHLMQLLAAYGGTTPHEVKLGYSRLNKPQLAPNLKNLEFNYTDTSENQNSIGLFAVTYNNAIGIDIEARSRQSDFLAIANKRFSQQELDYVTKARGQIDAQRFLCIWTRKEAYGKATGKGINFTMRNMNLASPGAFELNFLADEEAKPPFRLQQFHVGERYIAALVHQGHRPLSIKAFRSMNHIP